MNRTTLVVALAAVAHSVNGHTRCCDEVVVGIAGGVRVLVFHSTRSKISRYSFTELMSGKGQVLKYS